MAEADTLTDDFDMALVKYQGLGNDFLVLLDPDGRQPIDGALARAACDRHAGWGADGLVRLVRRPRAPGTG